MTTSFTPIAKSQRLEIIDLLRGFALLGILMVNLPLMNAPYAVQSGEFMLWTDPLNHYAHWFILFFFTGKFYTIFSMLFGIGFYFFLKKANETGESVLPVFRARLSWLLLIGILHVVLLWYGDILVFYALFGFVMILFRNKSNKALIVWAVIILTIPVLLSISLVGLMKIALSMPEVAESVQVGVQTAVENMKNFVEKALVVYSTGTFSEIVAVRLEEFQNILAGLLFFFPNVLAMFLIGMVLARNKVFEDIEVSKPFFKKLFFISLAVALVFNTAFAWFGVRLSMSSLDWNFAGYMVGQAYGAPALSFVYISIIAHCYHHGYFQKLSKAIINTGRMALTNYLMQSIIATTIFFSYGLGLYGKVNLWQGILLTVTIYVIQVLWSNFWLKYYRFGPMEWLWRSLTYRKMQKMKV